MLFLTESDYTFHFLPFYKLLQLTIENKRRKSKDERRKTKDERRKTKDEKRKTFKRAGQQITERSDRLSTEQLLRQERSRDRHNTTDCTIYYARSQCLDHAMQW
jgi:hypothetical protein